MTTITKQNISINEMLRKETCFIYNMRPVAFSLSVRELVERVIECRLIMCKVEILFDITLTHSYPYVSVESSLHISPTHSLSHMITSISESQAPLNNKKNHSDVRY